MDPFLQKLGQTRNRVMAAEELGINPITVFRRLKSDEVFAERYEVAMESYVETFRVPVNRLRDRKKTSVLYTLACAKALLPEWQPKEAAPAAQVVVNAQQQIVLLPEELRQQWRERLQV